MDYYEFSSLAGGRIAPAFNSAVSWELYMEGYTQSAGNLMRGSLGILRDYTPGLECMLMSNLSMRRESEAERTRGSEGLAIKGRPRTNMTTYLAGLIEGDGYIGVPEKIGERDKKGRLKYPSIQISFKTRDLPLAFMLQREIGMGSISKKKGEKASVYTVNNREGLVLLGRLINGKMRTPKINALNKLIDNLNASGGAREEIKKLTIDRSEIESNGWLSGFIEADGSFQVRSTKAGKYPARVECRLEIEQRQKDKSGESLYGIMERIAGLTLSEVKETKKGTKNQKFRVRTTSLRGNKAIKGYLEEYKLFGSKYLDYLDWKEVVRMFEKGEHKTRQGRDRIKEIKLTMNDNRKEVTWDHLKEFSLFE